MLCYAEKLVASSTIYLVNEQNDETTWRRYRNLVEPIFQMIKERRGLYEFKVVCDETTNTPQRRNSKQLWGYIALQPTLTAEQIISQFTLLPTGASFSELPA